MSHRTKTIDQIANSVAPYFSVPSQSIGVKEVHYRGQVAHLVVFRRWNLSGCGRLLPVHNITGRSKCAVSLLQYAVRLLWEAYRLPLPRPPAQLDRRPRKPTTR